MEPIIYKPSIYKPSIYNGPTLYKGDGSVYNGNGVYNGGIRPAPQQIIFASQDFINISVGSLSETTVTSSNLRQFFQNTHYWDNVFTGVKDLWNGRNYCLLNDGVNPRYAVIEHDELEDFSLQFYFSGTSGNSGAGSLRITGIFSFRFHWDDQWLLGLAWNFNPTNFTAYNGAHKDGGADNAPYIPVQYLYFSQFCWNLCSVCCKKVGSIYRIYLYINGTLYFSWEQNSISNFGRIGTGREASDPMAAISEIILYNFVRASDDFMTYPTNNYEPLL